MVRGLGWDKTRALFTCASILSAIAWRARVRILGRLRCLGKYPFFIIFEGALCVWGGFSGGVLWVCPP